MSGTSSSRYSSRTVVAPVKVNGSVLESRDDETLIRKSGGTLWKDKYELSQLRVQVRRGHLVNTTGPQLPLERSIDDPAKICVYVHCRRDPSKIPKPPIFGAGIKVNQNFDDNRQIFSHLKAERSQSRSRSRSVSSRYERKRSPSEERNSRFKNRSKKRVSKSRSPSSDRRNRSDDEHSRPLRKSSSDKREYEKRRKSKSPTPLRPGEYRPGHPDLAKRYNKKRSPSPNRREYEKYRHGRSISPLRRSRSLSPKRYDNKDRRSPGRSSGSSKNAKRSPTPRKHSKSPLKYNKRERSRSRGEKSYRYRSRSPARYEKRRSRSPYRSRDSRRLSPSSSKKFYGRSRSPRRRSRSPGFREHLPAEYGYYEGDFWIPGAVRPGFPMPAFYPPGFYPRGVVPGPMLMPRVPIRGPYGAYPHPRHPLPIYNSNIRPRSNRTTVPTSTVTSATQATPETASNSVVIREITMGNRDGEEKGETEEKTKSDNTNE